jgi:putative oxidoreductase
MSHTFDSIRIMLLIARLAFAVLFLWASFGKIIDPERFAQQVANYQIIGAQASAIVGAILPWAEFVFGACLLFGLWLPAAWIGAIVLFGCFVIAKAYVLARGLSVDCGCGVLDGTITPMSLLVSITLLLSAVAAYLCTVRKRIHFPTVKYKACPVNRKAEAVTIIAVMMFLSGWNTNVASGASDAETLTAAAIRRGACSDMQADFDRVVAAGVTQDEREKLGRRLDAMDRVTVAVLHDLRLHHSAFVNQSLATVGYANEGIRSAPLLRASSRSSSFACCLMISHRFSLSSGYRGIHWF